MALTKSCWPCDGIRNVQAGVYDKFTTAVTDIVRKLRLGDGMHPDTKLGPLINPAAVDRVSGVARESDTQYAPGCYSQQLC